MSTPTNRLVVDLLLETGGGGAGRHVLDLYTGLKKLGWNARLILSSRRADQGFTAEVAEIPHEDVMYLDLRRTPHISDLSAIARLRQYTAASGRRHLLHAHSTKAGMLGWALRGASQAMVLTPHAYRGMDPTLNRIPGIAIRRVETAYSRAYHKVIAVSPDEQQYLASLGIRAERVCYIPNGVDVANIRARIANAAQAQGSRPVIGFVGRLVYQKNPLLFLEAVRAVVKRGSNAQAIIVGDGPLRASLMETAAAFNLADRIEWRGDVPAVEELGRMAVVVHTSRYESFPYSLLEAAAAPVPIVAVGNSGSRAILGDLLPQAIVESAAPERLADSILQLIPGSPEREIHLSALEKISRRFTIQNMIAATVAVYEEMLGSSPK